MDADVPSRQRACRDTIALVDAETRCASPSLAQDSCYPVVLTVFGQDTPFVWNAHLAKFKTTDRIKIAIYAGSDGFGDSPVTTDLIARYSNLANPKGAVWAGNINYPFFGRFGARTKRRCSPLGGNRSSRLSPETETTFPDSMRSTMTSSQTTSTSSSNGGSMTVPLYI
ncbi:hypothetical protein B0H17DRAFT_1213936 [Mycena rosella]|uniref:Uncharacterized protein n=1 Tax=Mycena rosella TaxID=1033263 RepID=A0AAD7G1H6_MYCRO|nr:hypothetical protein B0H17DRAFT_1213936 [Mycena rosella]